MDNCVVCGTRLDESNECWKCDLTEPLLERIQQLEAELATLREAHDDMCAGHSLEVTAHYQAIERIQQLKAALVAQQSLHAEQMEDKNRAIAALLKENDK